METRKAVRARLRLSFSFVFPSSFPCSKPSPLFLLLCQESHEEKDKGEPC